MAIEVSLTSGSKGSVSRYSVVDFPGLTTTGSIFLQDSSNDNWYVYDSATGAYKQLGESLDSLISKNKPIQIEKFKFSVDFLLDSTAISYGYKDIDDAVSYYDSTITSKKNEAKAFVTWRDNTLGLRDENIYDFTADGVTLPRVDDGSFTSQDGYQEFLGASDEVIYSLGQISGNSKISGIARWNYTTFPVSYSAGSFIKSMPSLTTQNFLEVSNTGNIAYGIPVTGNDGITLDGFSNFSFKPVPNGTVVELTYISGSYFFSAPNPIDGSCL